MFISPPWIEASWVGRKQSQGSLTQHSRNKSQLSEVPIVTQKFAQIFLTQKFAQKFAHMFFNPKICANHCANKGQKIITPQMFALFVCKFLHFTIFFGKISAKKRKNFMDPIWDNYLFWNPHESMIECIKYGHLQIPLHSTPFSPRIGFFSLLIFMTFLCLNDDFTLYSYAPVLRGKKFPFFHFWDVALFTHFGFFVCLLSSSFLFQRSLRSLRGFLGRRSSYKVAD